MSNDELVRELRALIRHEERHFNAAISPAGMGLVSKIEAILPRYPASPEKEPLEKLAERKGKELRVDVAYSKDHYNMGFDDMRRYLNGLENVKVTQTP